MAVEDGAVLGCLLGRLNRADIRDSSKQLVSSILRLYETLRKSRTTVNVQGAVSNRYWYHLPDGPEQRARDAELAAFNWGDETQWDMISSDYQLDLLGFDMLQDAQDAFEDWLVRERNRLKRRRQQIIKLQEAQAKANTGLRPRIDEKIDVV